MGTIEDDATRGRGRPCVTFSGRDPPTRRRRPSESSEPSTRRRRRVVVVGNLHRATTSASFRGLASRKRRRREETRARARDAVVLGLRKRNARRLEDGFERPRPPVSKDPSKTAVERPVEDGFEGGGRRRSSSADRSIASAAASGVAVDRSSGRPGVRARWKIATRASSSIRGGLVEMFALRLRGGTRAGRAKRDARRRRGRRLGGTERARASGAAPRGGAGVWRFRGAGGDGGEHGDGFVREPRDPSLRGAPSITRQYGEETSASPEKSPQSTTSPSPRQCAYRRRGARAAAFRSPSRRRVSGVSSRARRPRAGPPQGSPFGADE